ncbi:MAG: cyclic nucleotide-binding/CBS domain-containing protein [Haloglomus sp.]
MNERGDTRVQAVMTSPVETISAETSVREAATRMRDNGFNALLVPGGRAGIVTSTDVLDVVADSRDPDDVTVGNVMTKPVESVTTDLRLEEAAAMMANYGINHLPVRDDDRDYVGMVSSTDLRETLF